jgi:hypothetical protein
MDAILRLTTLAALVVGVSALALAQDRAAYDRRNVERYLGLFQSLDRDRDDVVTREEAIGDLQFLPWFDEFDIGRDNSVSRAELERYLALEHGYERPAIVAPPPRDAVPAPTASR